ncbi:hypothetical protein KUCAC02_032392 [Chaenocephalus aceratus]|nr:hypothetical protein KUCAC02_032392 [Chaenocephalus aceratus]
MPAICVSAARGPQRRVDSEWLWIFHLDGSAERGTGRTTHTAAPMKYRRRGCTQHVRLYKHSNGIRVRRHGGTVRWVLVSITMPPVANSTMKAFALPLCTTGVYTCPQGVSDRNHSMPATCG